MPPHCDSLDGPVVTAARRALESGDVTLVLPFVPEESEGEVSTAFAHAVRVRALGEDARELADRHFFETTVRLHRIGEGATYTGLKPAGLSFGPVIPLAERAVESGSLSALADFLSRELRNELKRRLDEVSALARDKERSVADARRYVEAALSFEVFAHHLFESLHARAHEGGHGHRLPG
jgi:hypothetical protein